MKLFFKRAFLVCLTAGMLTAMCGCEFLNETLPIDGETTEVAGNIGTTPQNSNVNLENPELDVMFSEQGECNLTVILGNHANAEQTKVAVIEPLLDQLCRCGGHLTIIVSDGNPGANIHSFMIGRPDPNTLDYDEVYQTTMEDLKACFTSYIAQEPGDALVDAFRVAANDATLHTGENILVVMDSGYSNAGLLPLTSLATLDYEGTLDAMENAGYIPDLSKFKKAYWYGMNRVKRPQETGTVSDENTVYEFWAAFMTRGSVKYCISEREDGYYSLDEKVEFPPSNTIEVSVPETIVVQKPTPGEETTTEALTEATTSFEFRDAKFQFVPDTWEFSNVEGATAAVKDLIPKINKAFGNDGKIVLIGCCARYGDEKTAREAGYMRADAVRKLMIREGFEANRVECLGAGYSFPCREDVNTVPLDKIVGYVYDLDENGGFVSEKASHNRVVFCVSADSEYADDVRRGTEYKDE